MALKLEREVKTLDDLLQEAEQTRFREKFAQAYGGKNSTQVVRELREELSKKYPGEKLIEHYRQR